MTDEHQEIDARRQSLLKEIVAVFPTRMPKAVNAVLATLSPQPETMEIRSLLSGKDWRSLGDDVYLSGYPNIFVVGPVAVEYYLPGMMSAAIRNPDTVLKDQLVKSFLRPPIEADEMPKFAARFAGFTSEQKIAVAHFFELYRDENAEELPKIADRIDRAIHRYWLPPR